ncbi:MAG: 50S ribosomal protein L13 [Nitrospirae bacterium CG_4_9_14_3_um_filter_53_35]|nr:MAG: 50S ribosomal protein L13 [Nitrospirae bacterium CG2_30_53_67]PIS36457.1 MAG: 50S ribosomal protein L13 [Nitrospirae bacterium CG08_land_8_20_14_0_20_52_24]PIV84797.1 MAG: 50S ribosomal protein L13 [Nitrospirae bacterium CG17_big_fil_post_rev_8_21_14_2_50_50_9]PIW85160.1 MAG: 50S ribosomal protein L13 [Nitrospirae bacterium CG_4_8_14_3_um_filter_50_41]PIX85941.1 MAG: 50S ribosomal protein L13 [Nitrospirae bacterium CG_4_10_14_3_um_filter_53_41]PJA73627.1 MAG: 50S ribosomal protein L13 
MKTYMAKKEEQSRKWYILDLQDAVLGRIATRIAMILSGKNKPTYSPHVDTGDFMILTNADKVRLTGDKMEKKIYYHYSGYQGGLKRITAGRLLETHPERLIIHAVRGMLPKNRLGRAMLKKLKVYAGPHHPHEAQKPEQITLT